MLYLLLALIVLGVVVGIATLISQKKGATGNVIRVAQNCSTCTGESADCEQICMMKAATKPIEYYDDEELDTFRGRPSDSYTADELRLFADVLYTMRPEEVRGWTRSLNLRGVNLPDQIKDEVIMIIDDSQHEQR